MSDVELKRKESLTRQQAAERLSALADALAHGGRVHIDLGASSVALEVPDHVNAEIEVEVDGDEVELELEFKWSTASVPAGEPAKGDGTEHAKAPAKAHARTR